MADMLGLRLYWLAQDIAEMLQADSSMIDRILDGVEEVLGESVGRDDAPLQEVQDILDSLRAGSAANRWLAASVGALTRSMEATGFPVEGLYFDEECES
jgi:hypothetical protein